MTSSRLAESDVAAGASVAADGASARLDAAAAASTLSSADGAGSPGAVPEGGLEVPDGAGAVAGAIPAAGTVDAPRPAPRETAGGVAAGGRLVQ
jgi:hypothetical protein